MYIQIKQCTQSVLGVNSPPPLWHSDGQLGGSPTFRWCAHPPDLNHSYCFKALDVAIRVHSLYVDRFLQVWIQFEHKGKVWDKVWVYPEGQQRDFVLNGPGRFFTPLGLSCPRKNTPLKPIVFLSHGEHAHVHYHNFELIYGGGQSLSRCSPPQLGPLNHRAGLH